MPQVNISIDICESIYIRNPLETSLGKKIIKHSIILLNEIGFEDFNFKKLAIHMESTEASVYRYFENKYKLLAYLVSWYWDFMHFMILMDTRNMNSPKEKLMRMIESLVNSIGDAAVPEYVDHAKLHTIVLENATKVYHNKQVDELKKEGFYNNLKKLVKTISGTISEIDSDFKYPYTLAANIVDLSLNNEYNMLHLPRLTDFQDGKYNDGRQETIVMIKYMLKRILA